MRERRQMTGADRGGPVSEVGAILVAGGSGSRLASDTPKQFHDLQGRPMLVHALQPFQKSPRVASIIVVLPTDQTADWQERLREGFSLDKVEAVVEGGERRRDSVKAGLDAAAESGSWSSNSLVAVHDGARPLLAPALLESLIDAAAEHGAAVPVVPITDTVVKSLEEQTWGETVDRSGLALVQTPQLFRADLLHEAHCHDPETDFSDDAQMVQALGKSIRLVSGDPLNIKVTTPGDLDLVRRILVGGSGA
jgi:2-C-methyl-D-erythritol 4-phosphate cytidylyltransferase